MQTTDKANREIQRNAAYESLHYACLQAIEILKPTTIKERRREIVNVDTNNIEKFAKFSFIDTEAEINVNVSIRHTIETDGIITHDWQVQISALIEVKSPFFSYVFNAYDIERLYKKLAPLLPEYRNTYEIERFETETDIPEYWNYCATISDKKEFKAVTGYIDKKNDLRPNLQHIYIDAEASAMVASDSHVLTTRPIEAERSAMIPMDAQKYITESKHKSAIHINDTGDKLRVVNQTGEKTYNIDASLKYPKYKAVIPAKTDKAVIFADKKELLKSIKLVSKNANQASQMIRFKFDANKCTISAGDVDYKVSSSVAINCASTISGEIGFKASNIEKVLKSIDSNQIEFNLTDPSRAAMINGNCLIMPMMLDDECSTFAYITQQAAPIAEQQAETTGKNLPVLYIAPVEIVSNLPIIHTAPQETTEAETVRYLPVLYIKPKKIRKPRAKKNKEPTKQPEKPDIWISKKTETRENDAAQSDGQRKKRLYKYLLSVAMVCILLIINTDKVNGKNNSKEHKKNNIEVLRVTKKYVHLYHNNSNKAVVLKQSKMKTESKMIELSEDVKKAIKKNAYYSEEDFTKDAETYISAIKDGRMLCIVKSVSKSGMSRVLTFHSLEGDNTKYYRNYRAFFTAMGYKKSRSGEGFTVNGCGMDMIFHTNYSIMHDLRRMGFITESEAETLCQKTPTQL